MKYAEKHSAAMVSEMMSWNNMSTPCDPSPYYAGAVENSERTSYQNKHLENLRSLVLRRRHSVAYIRKCPADGSKLFRNLVHALNDNGESVASQPEQAAQKPGSKRFPRRPAFLFPQLFPCLLDSLVPVAIPAFGFCLGREAQRFFPFFFFRADYA